MCLVPTSNKQPANLAGFFELGVGGAERIFLEYASFLSQAGWNVHVILGGEPAPEEEARLAAWAEGIRFRKIHWKRRTQYPFPIILPSLDWQAVRGLRDALEEIGPDIVVVNQPGPDDAQGAIRAAAQLDPPAPIVSLVHLVAPRQLKMRLRRLKMWWARRLYRRLSAIVTCSNACAEALRADYRIPPDKVHVVHNGVPEPGPPPAAEELGQLRQSIGAGPEDVLALWAGRFTTEKGVDVLLEAARIACASGPRLRIALAGEGPLKTALETRFSELVASGKVSFLGWRDDVDRLLHACDIAAMPSRLESFGMFLAEAMACGKPCIGARTVGIPEVVADGETGLLVPLENPEVLADALLQLASDPALRVRMGAAGRRRYEQHFRLGDTARRFEAALRNLLKHAREGRP